MYSLQSSFLFQSTLPRGERHSPSRPNATQEIFQSTLPRGERHSICVFESVRKNFNPRSHEGSDSCVRILLHLIDRFQSTLPRGERRYCHDNKPIFNDISIHAPTRGATLIDLFIRIFLDNFNPRSHEGSDDYTPNSRTISSDFNPRSHEGSDPACFYPETGKIISIHAPTRGATDPEYHRNLVQKKFQSTLPRGERLNCTMTAIIKLLFQSTLPRGERRGCQTAFVKHLNYFNPRSHEGSDSNFRQKVLFSLSKNCLKYLILTTNYFN